MPSALLQKSTTKRQVGRSQKPLKMSTRCGHICGSTQKEGTLEPRRTKFREWQTFNGLRLRTQDPRNRCGISSKPTRNQIMSGKPNVVSNHSTTTSNG